MSKKKERKIKFKQYDISYKNHSYCILIPEHTENVRVTGYGFAVWGTNWMGDREALRTLMYSAAVLGFNPQNKIIYFPIRKNKKLPTFDYRYAFPGEKQNEVEDCDMIFTTHQVQLQRSKWKKLKEIMKYTKASTYVFEYDEARTETYFENKIQQWKKTDAYYKDKCLVETMVDHTLFYVFSKMQFQDVYIALHDFLKSDLEQATLCNSDYGKWICAMKSLMVCDTTEGGDDGKNLFNHPWLLFYDEKMEKYLKYKKIVE